MFKLRDMFKDTLEHDNDFITITGNIQSATLIAVPHLGNIVPDQHRDENGQPLGLDPQILNTHEGVDIYAKDLISAIHHHIPAATTISCALSRLIIDMDRVSNRIPRHLYDPKNFGEQSNIDPKIGRPIPGNQNISKADKDWRLNQYATYHAALKMLVDATTRKFGTCNLVHLHTFEPEIQGDIRDTQLGTFKCGETDFTKAFEAAMTQHAQSLFTFKPDAPYDIRTNGTTPARAACNAFATNRKILGGVPMIGLEINQSLAQNERDQQLVCEILKSTLEDLSQKPPTKEQTRQKDHADPRHDHPA